MSDSFAPSPQTFGALAASMPGGAEHMNRVPYGAALGMKLVEVTSARATLSLPWREDLVGDPASGVLHGGVITALMDSACGIAVFAALTEMTAIATLDLRIDYLKPARPHATVYAACHCYKVTSTIAFIRGIAHQGDLDDPIAHCAATFMLGANRAGPARRPRATEGGAA
ncbi:PaaI family thioesterase [Zavarzinia sp. CC-PAN008]|uniref:PaaI family thioesterase n=1 Tax=Zavarzinia sp. CC-PAN008 TaxID=3243332 RepID=UPI003F747987